MEEEQEEHSGEHLRHSSRDVVGEIGVLDEWYPTGQN